MVVFVGKALKRMPPPMPSCNRACGCFLGVTQLLQKLQAFVGGNISGRGA
jgi:hypothetical protein